MFKPFRELLILGFYAANPYVNHLHYRSIYQRRGIVNKFLSCSQSTVGVTRINSQRVSSLVDCQICEGRVPTQSRRIAGKMRL